MFVELKKVYSETEAQVLVTHLSDEGIESFIEKDDVGGLHPHLQSSRGVKVLVKEEDLEKAKQIIEVDDENLANWLCSSCGETHEGQFNICWNCGQEKS